MTDEPDELETELMRRMLGLPNKFRKSYRNRHVASTGGTNYEILTGLCKKGWAVNRGKDMPDSWAEWFTLTRAGAEKVLKKGETLSKEDFPIG